MCLYIRRYPNTRQSSLSDLITYIYEDDDDGEPVECWTNATVNYFINYQVIGKKKQLLKC